MSRQTAEGPAGMSHLLRPGVHVMRRLRLPGKLALVAAVLLVRH